MQAPGANPNQALASLFGAPKATEGEESAFAAVFSNLMQNFAADGTTEITSPEAIKALDELNPAEANFLASLGVQIPASQEPASFQGDLPADGIEARVPTVSFQKVLPAALINVAAANADTANADTANVDAANGVTLDLAEISALPEGAKAELLQALKGMAQKGEAPALTLTAPGGEAHILPVSELAALINGTEAETTTIAQQQTQVAAPTTLQAAAPASVTSYPAQPAPEGTSETLAASLVGNAGGTEASLTADSAQAVAAATGEATETAQAQADAPDMMTNAAVAQAAAAGKQADQQDEQAQQQADQQAQNTPDGYVVATGQPQQNTAAQNNAGQPGKKAPTAAAADKIPTGDSQPAAAQSRGEALTARAIDPVMARSETALPPNVAREPSLTMTPERLAGMPDGSASEMVSAGLSGMRGDSSFMSSMSLLGGHASRGLQGHVAKQLNMNVSKAVKAGESEFTMRLDPAELGRVQVKLKFMEGGRVHAQVVAERPETLDLLQRDARGLERAIQGAGAKAQGATIEFSLDQGGNEESAGKAFAEAVQQEKMRDTLAARSAGGHALPFGDDGADMEDVPLDDILPYVDAETGLDIRV